MRELTDWIDSFLEYTDGWALSPKIFRKWAAFSTISAAIERRAWSIISGHVCFCNLYVLMVATPGVGKSVAAELAKNCLIECKERPIFLAPSGMTKAAFIDHVMEKKHVMTYNGVMFEVHPLFLLNGEFGTLMPEYNIEFCNVLNAVFDCEDVYEDRTRKDGHKIIERPYISMFTGTQPDYLKLILPNVAFGLGFTSRTIMVYSAEKMKRNPYMGVMKNEALREKLILDLRSIQKVLGAITMSPEALEFMTDWYFSMDEHAPDHPLLQNYLPRRHQHLQKLAMISSLSRSSNLVMELEDCERATEMLHEAEDLMPQIFKAMASSDDAKEIEECHRFCIEYCDSWNEEAIPEADLLRFMHERIPVHKIDFFLKALQDSGKISMVGVNASNMRKYKPIRKKKTKH